MNRSTTWWSVLTLFLFFCAFAVPASAINNSIPAIRGDVSRLLLGDGTGVVVGIIDSGVDVLHPALAGTDSLGMPRLVAQSNFVTSEPGNFGDDVFGHGTWVASAALSRDPVYTGMASDARFVNARVLDSNTNFFGDGQVMNGIGFAIGQGADVLNLSLNYGALNNIGFSPLELIVDWAAFDRRVNCVVCAGNIAPGGPTQVRGPGSAFNGVSVGRTTADYSRVHLNSSTSFTGDGRMKPEVVAPSVMLNMANDDWEGDAPDFENNFQGIPLSGCSFAAPHVTGMIAQQLEAGDRLGLSTDPLVVKATMMNSAVKVLNKQGAPWRPELSFDNGGVTTSVQPLDAHSGAGQINGLTLSQQYLAGEMAPGPVAPIGWDLNAAAQSQAIDYTINQPVGTALTATLTWYRHVGRADNGNGVIDEFDSYFVTQSLSNLDLQILRDGNLIADSTSMQDNVEHLRIAIEPSSQYTLRVQGTNVFGGSEQFALAWFTTVPEPGTMSIAVLCVGLGIARGRTRRRALAFNGYRHVACVGPSRG